MCNKYLHKSYKHFNNSDRYDSKLNNNIQKLEKRNNK